MPDVIRCTGTDEAIGRAHGEQLRDLVVRSQRLVDELEAFKLARPWWLPYGMFRRIARSKASKVWRTRLAQTVPGMHDRLRGMANATGADLAELHLLNIMEPVLSDLTQITVPVTPACSAIAVTGHRTAGGQAMIGRNFDYLPVVQPFYVLRDVRPAEGYRSIDFTVAPLAGAVDGMNEHGLAITNNYAYVTDHGDPDQTITMAIARALATCKTVDDAREFFTTHHIWGGGMLMVADANGDILSIELSNTKCATRQPRKDALFHTNKFCDPKMAMVELPSDHHYDNGAVRPLRGIRVHDSAEARDARLEEFLQAGQEPWDPDHLARVMGDHGETGEPSLGSICMHSDYWATTATVQMLPAERTMRIAFDSACRAEFTDITF